MSFSKRLWPLLLAVSLPAFSAITNPDAGSASLPFSGAGGTVVANSADAVGDLIDVYIALNNATSACTIVVSDNVNTGNYTLIGSLLYLSGPSQIEAHYYKVANAVGTPTITVGSTAGCGGSTGGNVGFQRFTGWPGTPTLDASTLGINNGVSASVTGSTNSTTQNPELMVGFVHTAGGTSQSGTYNWTSTVARTTYSLVYYNLVTSAPPQSQQLTVTLNASDTWNTQTVGFYNGSSSSPTQGGFALSPSN